MLNCSTMFFSTWETCIWSFLHRICLPWSLNAGNLIMLQQVRLMMFWLNMADYSMSSLLLSTWFFPSFILKSYGWGGVGWWVDVPWDFSVSPRPLGFGFLDFGAKGLGPGLDNTYFLILRWIYIFNRELENVVEANLEQFTRFVMKYIFYLYFLFMLFSK